ncbi:hypothetical protein [Lentzea sp. NPDC051838]|uniref:hypothetical protein n=1 Tax=Lentzea sp. NPDC051838 TaxID=3154849 RepID=UPI0034156206
MVPLESIELAELNIPDDPRVRARFEQQQPAETYDARDRSGFVVVTVNRSRMVTNVRIRPRWYEHVPPQAFPAALYNTYVAAVQRALGVELTHRPPQPAAPPPPNSTYVDAAELSLEQWLAATDAQLDAIGEQYEAIRDARPRPATFSEVRSPLGYLVMRVGDGGPIAIHGDPRALDNPSDAVLSEDALQLFVRAGLGLDLDDRPRFEETDDVSETDDEYFEDFNVLREVDEDE